MSIEITKLEEFGNITKVTAKPTKRFPDGHNYFYIDSCDMNLVQAFKWYFVCADSRENIVASYRDSTINLHKEVYFAHTGERPRYVLKRTGVFFDIVSENLVGATNTNYGFYKVTRGYSKINSSPDSFLVCTEVNKKNKNAFGVVHSEADACVQRRYFEEHMLKDLIPDYNPNTVYSFLLDRRNDLDILDLERTGQISKDEGTYRHVMRYADNAWYYYRYNLVEYFKDNNIPTPTYDLDENGFMIDTITRKRLH
jgi:hypothetical protein